MSRDLNYYKIPYTHQIDIVYYDIVQVDQKHKKYQEDIRKVQAYLLCPDIIDSRLISLLEDDKFEKSIYRPWSFKYEFINYYNIFLNNIETNNITSYKIFNENEKCPLCNCKIQNKNNMNQIYYIPEIHYVFSPFIIHMMKVHDYKPPEKFIEYVLLKVYETDADYNFLKLEEDTMSFFINFDNYNMIENFKFIDKDVGNLNYNNKRTFFERTYYKNLFLQPTSNQIIQEFNTNLGIKYIDSEIVGSFDIENNNQGRRNKFYSVKKVIIVNRINNKEYQVNNGRGDEIYFFQFDDSNKYKIDYHIHPDYISSGPESIKRRIIEKNTLFEIFSQADIEIFFKRLKDLQNPLCSSLIFTQEGIYQYSPDLDLNPYDITQEQIEKVFEEINIYIAYLSETYKSYLVFQIEDGIYNQNEDYNSIIYHNCMFFKYLQSKLSEISINFIFYPKELKEDGTWGYGNIYMPIIPEYKKKLIEKLLPLLPPLNFNDFSPPPQEPSPNFNDFSPPPQEPPPKF